MGKFFGNHFKTLLFISISLSLFSQFAQAAEISLDDIRGNWIRVGEGCRMLDEKEILNLPYSGGGNTIRRRMVLELDDNKFISTSFKSLRCEEKDFTKNDKVDFQNENIRPVCDDTQNVGEMSLDSTGFLTLNATNCSRTTSPWGCAGGVNWKIKRLGSTLVINNIMDYDACAPTPLYIYFVPYPMM